jgi:hypothetical protein
MLARALLILFPALICFGQAGKVEISGTVQDPAGMPVVAAHVIAREQSTDAHFEVMSDAGGAYHLLGLPPGEYLLQVNHPSFRSYRRTGMTLRLGDHVELNLQLTLGAQKDSIEVNGQASLLQTTGGAVTYHVDERKITTLPLDGRNFIPLIALAPGVALPGGGSLLPRINGSRPRTNEYLYDGISVLQPEPGQVAFYPIIDAMEEFTLNINSYSPEYGRSNGGTVMVVGKSGGNSLHGTLFEFIRNENMNARNLFAQPGSKPEFRRNQFGATLGGPLRRNQTFFFVDWQSTYVRKGLTRFSTVPTPKQRAGFFSTPVYDPATSPRRVFAGNAIPASRFDVIAQQVLALYPVPNLPGAANNYVRTRVEPDTQHQFDTRLDQIFNENHRAFVRYSFLRDDDTPVTPLPDGSGLLTSGVIGHALTRGDGIASEYDWTFSPRMLNQARFGYSRRTLNQDALQTGGIHIPGVPPGAFPATLPIFNVSGFQQIGPNAAANSNFATSVTEYLDTFSIIDGRHTIKFGVDIRREVLDVVNPANPTGTYAFNTTGTNASGVVGSGNAVASLLLGQVSAFSIDIQNRPLRERAHIAEGFIGDEWKASSRVVLNIGTRYTLNFPSTEVKNQAAVFNLKTELLDFPHTARNLECCDFGPRVGVAYRASDSLVLRSGYGLVWFEQTGITSPFTLPQFPFVQTISQQSQDNLNPAFLLSSGTTIQAAPPNANSGLGQGVFGVDRYARSGYSQQWNFTVQKAFGRNLNFEIGYLGSKNTHLGLPEANLNQLPAADLAMGAALLAKVPNPFFAQIPANSSLGGPTVTRQQLLRAFPRFTNVALFRDNTGDSEYNALQIKLEQRVSHGLAFTFSYTFSKLIDDASTYFSQTIFTGPVLNTTGAADAFNRKLERDLSTGDIPRVFTAGWTYAIPRVAKIGGWQIAGLVRVQSGDTVAISQAVNNNAALGYALQRPNRVADPNVFNSRSVREWLNVAAFTNAPQFTIGTSSRNPIRGPGLQNADLMLSKTFRFTERLQFDFRAEVFNVTNTPPLNDPNASFGSAAFATITSAGNPRDFEFAAKLHF